MRGGGAGEQRLMTVGRMQNVVKSLAKRSDAQVDCWVGGYGCKDPTEQNRREGKVAGEKGGR